MSDDQLPENPPPAPTPAAAPAQQPAASALESPEVRAFVAAEVERVRNATWKQARESMGKRSNGAAPTPEAQPTSQPTAPPQATGLTAHDILRVSAFTAAASEHGIPPRGVEMLLERVMTEKPADVRAWTATEAAQFGWSKPTTTAPAPTPAAPAASQASGPPVTSNGAPSSVGRVTDDVPLIDRSPADQDAYRKQHGLVPFTDRLLREARENKTRLRLPR